MTKKFSILSIVVVLLISVCLVGCGDDSSTEKESKTEKENYAQMIVGKWKFTKKTEPDGDLKHGDGYIEFSEDGLITDNTDRIIFNETKLYYTILNNSIYIGGAPNDNMKKSASISNITGSELVLEIKYEHYYFSKIE